MTDNERLLIELIRDNDDPTRALTTAIDIILSVLAQQRSSEEQAAVATQESA